MKTSVLLVLLVLFLGCASTPKGTWIQAGRTSAQMHADLADCKLQAQQFEQPGMAFAPLFVRNGQENKMREFISDCMQGKGYHFTP